MISIINPSFPWNKDLKMLELRPLNATHINEMTEDKKVVKKIMILKMFFVVFAKKRNNKSV